MLVYYKVKKKISFERSIAVVLVRINSDLVLFCWIAAVAFL